MRLSRARNTEAALTVWNTYADATMWGGDEGEPGVKEDFKTLTVIGGSACAAAVLTAGLLFTSTADADHVTVPVGGHQPRACDDLLRGRHSTLRYETPLGCRSRA
jgi:hypothetical protein